MTTELAFAIDQSTLDTLSKLQTSDKSVLGRLSPDIQCKEVTVTSVEDLFAIFQAFQEDAEKLRIDAEFQYVLGGEPDETKSTIALYSTNSDLQDDKGKAFVSYLFCRKRTVVVTIWDSAIVYDVVSVSCSAPCALSLNKKAISDRNTLRRSWAGLLLGTGTNGKAGKAKHMNVDRTLLSAKAISYLISISRARIQESETGAIVTVTFE